MLLAVEKLVSSRKTLCIYFTLIHLGKVRIGINDATEVEKDSWLNRNLYSTGARTAFFPSENYSKLIK